jgi:hypothetical protein
MTKADLLQRIIDNHNRIAQMEVRGDNTILVAETLIDLRHLLKQLQNESVKEEIQN